MQNTARKFRPEDGPFKYKEQCPLHCWHPHTGFLWMVVPQGHVVEDCCVCGAMRTIHREHRGEG